MMSLLVVEGAERFLPILNNILLALFRVGITPPVDTSFFCCLMEHVLNYKIGTVVLGSCKR